MSNFNPFDISSYANLVPQFLGGAVATPPAAPVVDPLMTLITQLLQKQRPATATAGGADFGSLLKQMRNTPIADKIAAEHVGNFSSDFWQRAQSPEQRQAEVQGKTGAYAAHATGLPTGAYGQVVPQPTGWQMPQAGPNLVANAQGGQTLFNPFGTAFSSLVPVAPALNPTQIAKRKKPGVTPAVDTFSALPSGQSWA